jgi:hypothetical protein
LLTVSQMQCNASNGNFGEAGLTIRRRQGLPAATERRPICAFMTKMTLNAVTLPHQR